MSLASENQSKKKAKVKSKLPVTILSGFLGSGKQPEEDDNAVGLHVVYTCDD